MARRIRNQHGAAKIAEFGVVLFVFFMIILFPLINLIGLATGAGTLYLLTTQAAMSAGASATYAEALTAMETTCRTIAASGFGQFAKLVPVSGYSGCGANLFVVVTPVAGGPFTTFGPNTAYVSAIDNDANIYEYQVRTVYDVGPFLNLSAVPFIGTVPGIGAPARLSFIAHRNTEFTEGLALGGTGSTGGAGGSGGGTGTGGASGVMGAGTIASGTGSGGGGGLVINGIYYSPSDVRWWNNHADDTDEWNNQPNPFMTLGDPSTFANGQPNPYYP